MPGVHARAKGGARKQQKTASHGWHEQDSHPLFTSVLGNAVIIYMACRSTVSMQIQHRCASGSPDQALISLPLGGTTKVARSEPPRTLWYHTACTSLFFL